MSATFSTEGKVFHFKKIAKKNGGHFCTFSVAVYQGKNQDGTYKPDGWDNIKVGGELGETLELEDKQRIKASGMRVWNDGIGEEKKYRGWEYWASSVVAQEGPSQSASQKKGDDSELPF